METWTIDDKLHAADDLLQAVRFALKYHKMQAAKGNPFPSQLVNTLEKAIAKAERGISQTDV